jgi:hypothetical protein
MWWLPQSWVLACSLKRSGADMSNNSGFAVAPAREFRDELPAWCHECRRSFHAKSEDQLSLELCDACYDALRHAREQIISVHVKARPPKPAVS